MTKGRRSWYSVFVNLTLSRPFCRQLLWAWFFELCVTCIFPYGFSIPLHWYSHANNIGRNIYCCRHYYIVSILVCSSLSPIRNAIFHQKWYIINSRDALQRSMVIDINSNPFLVFNFTDAFYVYVVLDSRYVSLMFIFLMFRNSKRMISALH